MGVLGGGRSDGNVDLLGRGRLDDGQHHAQISGCAGYPSAISNLRVELSGSTKSAIFEAPGTSSRTISKVSR